MKKKKKSSRKSHNVKKKAYSLPSVFPCQLIHGKIASILRKLKGVKGLECRPSIQIQAKLDLGYERRVTRQKTRIPFRGKKKKNTVIGGNKSWKRSNRKINKA